MKAEELLRSIADDFAGKYIKEIDVNATSEHTIVSNSYREGWIDGVDNVLNGLLCETTMLKELMTDQLFEEMQNGDLTREEFVESVCSQLRDFVEQNAEVARLKSVLRNTKKDDLRV